METACVRIEGVNNGCGFFAAKSFIITCCHLFKRKNNELNLNIGDNIRYYFAGVCYEAQVEEIAESEDLALLHVVSAPKNHRYLKLDQVAVPDTTVKVYGYPNNEKMQRSAIAVIGEENENGHISLHHANDTTLGYSGGPVCPKTEPNHVVGVFYSIMGVDSNYRQTELSGMIAASKLLDIWGDRLEEARYIVESNKNNLFVYNSLQTDFIDPDNNLSKLDEFVNDSNPVLWWTVVAEGGSGKSRLAYEFAHSLPSTWRCCLLRPDDLKRSILDSIYESAGRDLLLIADYAYIDTIELGQWLSNVIASENRNKYPNKIRVLLLQRHGNSDKTNPSVPWRQTLLHGHHTLEEYHYSSEDLVLKKLEKPHLIKIMRSFADKRGADLDNASCEKLYTALKNVDSTLARPLFAMFITDALLSGESPYQWNATAALNHFCNREISMLENVFHGSSSMDMAMSAERLWVLATITNSCSFTNESLPEVIVEMGMAFSTAEFGRSLYRAHYARQIKKIWTMKPMTPDILGEFFVLKYFQDNPTAISDFLSEAQQISADNTFDFLIRMFADHDTSIDMVRSCSRNSSLQTHAVSLGLIIRGDYVNLKKMFKETGEKYWLIQFTKGLVTYIERCVESEEADDALSQLKTVYNQNQGNREIAVSYARGLFIQFYKQGDDTLLSSLEKVYIDNLENDGVAAEYASGLFCKFNELDDHKEAEKVLKCLEDVYSRFSKNREVAYTYATSLFNQFCNEEDFENAEVVLCRLGDVYDDNIRDARIAELLAKGLYKSICDQENLEKKDMALSRLKDVYKQNLGNGKVAIWYGRGILIKNKKPQGLEKNDMASNSMKLVLVQNPEADPISTVRHLFNRLYNQDDLGEAEKILSCMETVYSKKKKNRDVAVAYARGLCVYLSKQEDTEKADLALSKLEAVYDQNSEETEVIAAFAIGIFIRFNQQDEI